MLASRHVRSGIRLATMFALIVASASCGEDTTEPEEEEPSTTQVRLTIGSQTQTFGPSGGAITLSARGAVTVSAVWLKADGTSDPIANASEFRLQVTPPASGVGSNITYSGTGHGGTLTIPAAVTNAPVQFGLLHIAENHTDFGPLTVSITAP